MNVKRALGQWLARRTYVAQAIRDRADLSAFSSRPSMRVILGLVIIALSYLLGWPAVGLLAAVAALLEEPLWLTLGGPAIYGFSYLVFFVGLFLAGREYATAFARWAARMAVLRLLGAEAPPAEPPCPASDPDEPEAQDPPDPRLP